jgi:hypothetical protein
MFLFLRGFRCRAPALSAARVRDPRDFYSLRQLLANAAIAASRAHWVDAQSGSDLLRKAV